MTPSIFSPLRRWAATSPTVRRWREQRYHLFEQLCAVEPKETIVDVGAGWGAFVLSKPHVVAEHGAELGKLVTSGAVKPVVGARFPLADAAEALALIDGRSALGKVVLDVR